MLQNIIDDHPSWGRILKMLDYLALLILVVVVVTVGAGGGGAIIEAMKGLK